MKVVICGVDVSGYSAASWRAMAALPNLDLFVLTVDLSQRAKTVAVDTDFDVEPLMSGIPHRLLSPGQFTDAGLIAGEVVAQRPDAVVLPGWAVPQYAALTRVAALRTARFIMNMDTAWNGSVRQLAGRWIKRGYFKRIDGVVVSGERAHRLARWFGFPERRIIRGIFGIDFERLSAALPLRCAAPQWPRSFIYVGRYAKEKGIDVLVEGYRRYRAAARDPWSLSTCGRGPLAPMLQGQPGVTDLGFTQPGDLPGVLSRHGAFVIASPYEGWGVAIAEAVAAGLPVVATHGCAAALDVVRPYYNGLVVPTGEPGELADAMHWIDSHAGQLPHMGARGQGLAGAYASDVSAQRWEALFRLVIRDGPRA